MAITAGASVLQTLREVAIRRWSCWPL